MPSNHLFLECGKEQLLETPGKTHDMGVVGDVGCPVHPFATVTPIRTSNLKKRVDGWTFKDLQIICSLTKCQELKRERTTL